LHAVPDKISDSWDFLLRCLPPPPHPSQKLSAEGLLLTCYSEHCQVFVERQVQAGQNHRHYSPFAETRESS
jgi:hypothetical protein